MMIAVCKKKVKKNLRKVLFLLEDWLILSC